MSETIREIKEIVENIEMDMLTTDEVVEILEARERKVLGEIVEKARELYEFAEHDRDCLLGQWRQGRPRPDGRYETLYGYGDKAKWYLNDDKPGCSCGLDEAWQAIKQVAEKAGEKTEKEEE